ncbi:MAG: UDP-N-acetylglucosamine 2-epimerase (hydrolyzing) [Rhodospirillaceae bacterium]|nr:UDP-N-acetylglucosamine 2-epimerase (hydrolyzing) [Rhodospirillaceae bacterium]|tara:strand:- start:754 stop:1911 length:1158 start_codon:yes stop_codon:yes gene_type:complete
MKKICVVIGSRANYSSIRSVLKSISLDSNLQLQLIVGASALLSRYGSVIDLIRKDGFNIDGKVNMLIEGESPTTMAQSTGVGLLNIPPLFEDLEPDIVLTVGDRFETMATAISAAYMNIPLAHTMGGEVSGTIDESIRHAITKFAHIHFPSSKQAYDRIVRMGEEKENVHLVGCPRIDIVKDILTEAEPYTKISNRIFDQGVGEKIDIDSEFILVSQHPVTTEYGHGKEQILNTLNAVKKIGFPAIVLWPNADAGSEDLAKGIRTWRERGDSAKIHFFKNLPMEIYIQLMKRTLCLVGNSSSGIREGAFIGTPAVNIGTRQAGRERGENVLDIDYSENNIIKAIKSQIDHGPFQSKKIYGDGFSGEKIAKILSSKKVSIQKRITY